MARKVTARQLRSPVDTLASLRLVLSVPAIEGLAREVIDRLSRRDGADWSAPPDEVHTLCRYLCAPYPYAANQMIDQLLDAGVPSERIHRNYLAAAARHLGDQWQKNDLTFEEVGIATTRIYLIVDTIRQRFSDPVLSVAPRIAFAAVPGEQHHLGLTMATDAFCRAGWNVMQMLDCTHDQIVEAASDADIVLIGLSASGRRRRAALLKLVVALRVVRPDLKILLSGNIANTEPDFLSQIGIDEIVTDIPEALTTVQRLLGDVPRHAN